MDYQARHDNGPISIPLTTKKEHVDYNTPMLLWAAAERLQLITWSKKDLFLEQMAKAIAMTRPLNVHKDPAHFL